MKENPQKFKTFHKPTNLEEFRKLSLKNRNSQKNPNGLTGEFHQSLEEYITPV